MLTMRTPARLLVIPVVAALSLAACGDEDDANPSGATTTAAVTTVATTTPAVTTAPAATTAVAPTTGDEQPAAENVKEITLKVGLDSSPDRVETVRVGQEVIITMQSDQDEEYHLHGYDLTQRAAAGVEAIFSFTADQPGRFELESHVTHDVLLVLDIQP
jgi:hypothetical protein